MTCSAWLASQDGPCRSPSAMKLFVWTAPSSSAIRRYHACPAHEGVLREGAKQASLKGMLHRYEAYGPDEVLAAEVMEDPPWPEGAVLCWWSPGSDRTHPLLSDLPYREGPSPEPPVRGLRDDPRRAGDPP